MFEVEMKARVGNPDQLRQKIDTMGRFVKNVDKSDEYFILPSAGFPFRLRKDGGETFLTVKEKTWDGAVEVNREFETRVDDDSAIRKIADAAGFMADFTKTKQGTSHTVGDIHVEIVHVPPLGHFLEAEIVLEDDGDRGGAADRIRDLFRTLGIDESDWEKRYYSEMLKTYDGQESSENS